MPKSRLRQTHLTVTGNQDTLPRAPRNPRKRTTQPRSSASDNDKRLKRVKDGNEATTPAPKPKPTKETSRTPFSFKNRKKAAFPTPRLPKRFDEESDAEFKDTGNETATGESDCFSDEVSDDDASSDVGSVVFHKRINGPVLPRGPKKGAKMTTSKANALIGSYASFDPQAQAAWMPGNSVPFSELTETFLMIEGTTKRLMIARYLTQFFRCILTTTPEDLLPTVYLCVNKLGPAHEGLELGIGDATLIRAIANVSGGGDIARIKKQYESEGDLGSVAVSCKRSQNVLMKFKDLTIPEVFKKLKEIATDSGDKSQERKRNIVEHLLNSSKGIEAKFITRALQSKLRIGLAEQTVLQSIGQAFFMESWTGKNYTTLSEQMDNAVETVKQAYSTCPSYDQLIECLQQHGLGELKQRLCFTPGIPVQPMLAKPTTGIREVLEKFADSPFTCEFKYDGERSQIHILDDKSVRIYTRNAENVTGKYPDIAQRIRSYLKRRVQSVVLDCECVAYDREQQKILPFQRLSTRARKDVSLANIKVDVCLFCFDCLYLNGESLLQKSLIERRQALYSTINPEVGYVQFAEHQTSNNVEELQTFLDNAVQGSTEGLIVKTLDCTYEPSKRSVNWLKLKKDYMDGVGDSFDLVVIGAWHGKGKRTGVFGSFLLAAYDPVDDEYQSITKLGTGFSEDDLESLTQSLKSIKIPEPPSNYNYGGEVPDVWFDAKIVWEVKAADLSVSPVHKAAIGILDEAKGISIRFPRLVRVREDKEPTGATSSEQVAQMYKEQENSTPMAS